MFAVSDIASSTPSNHQSQGQAQLIASVVAQQKVIAAQNGASSGKAGDDQNARDSRARALQDTMRAPTQEQRESAEAEATRRSDEAKRLVEARETSESEDKIRAAFASRRDLSELLSVIRDPEDRMLPKDPEDLKV